MTVEPETQNLAPEEVRAALERVLASDLFRGSPQLGAFLRFVVEAVLRGEQDRIKGYTIAIEAFGRDANFDPQTDPIVRVEGTRLRRTLERYYAGPGAADPVIIELPRGSYVPVMRAGRLDDTPATTAEWRWPSRRAALGLGALAVVAATAFFVIAGPRPALRDTPAQATGPLRINDGVPVLAVDALETRGTPVGRPVVSAGLVEKLRDAFARFDTIRIVADSTPPAQPASANARLTGIDYRLTGTLEYQPDGSARVTFRLLDAVDGTFAWSRTFDPIAATKEPVVAEEELVLQLATTLLQPFGVIRARERVRHLAGQVRSARYKCILETSDAFRSFDPADHRRARLCLEELTASDPSYSLGFSYLGAIYYREHQFGFDEQPGAPALDRALRMARRAVELKPESARNYHALFVVLTGRGEINAAFAAGDKAMALNQYDMTIVADYGGRLIMSGEIERGVSMVRRAVRFGAVHPSWHHFFLFLASYLTGDLPGATHHATQITTETYPLGLVARAVTAAANKDQIQARNAVDGLVALRPAWRSDPRKELGRFFPSGAIVERFARDLETAGLAHTQ